MSIEIDVALPGEMGRREYHHLSIVRQGELKGEVNHYRVFGLGEPLGFTHLYSQGWKMCVVKALLGLHERDRDKK